MQVNELTHVGVDKMKRYKWEVADAPGRLLMMDKNLLQVDLTYQREATRQKVLRIASEWSWVAAGALIVAERADGRFFVIDGQHRALAAMKLSAVTHLPCVVFKTRGKQDEAEGFIRANRDRKPMTAIQSFRALVTAGDTDAIFLDRLLNDRGLRPAPGSSSQTAFQCTGRMLKIARAGHDLAVKCLDAAIAACSGGQVHNEILGGLSYIGSMSGDHSILDRMAPRLKAIGREELLRSISQAKAMRRVGGEKVCAEGILNAYNHRLRNKIELP